MTFDQDNGWKKPLHTGVLVLAGGEVIEGYGLGAVGEAVGEV
jgi:carbamoyl-phosphate synthase small subunit